MFSARFSKDLEEASVAEEMTKEQIAEAKKLVGEIIMANPKLLAD